MMMLRKSSRSHQPTQSSVDAASPDRSAETQPGPELRALAQAAPEPPTESFADVSFVSSYQCAERVEPADIDDAALSLRKRPWQKVWQPGELSLQAMGASG